MERGDLPRRVGVLREKSKWRSHKGESTDAKHRGGATYSRVEGSVMGLERRGRASWQQVKVDQAIYGKHMVLI